MACSWSELSRETPFDQLLIIAHADKIRTFGQDMTTIRTSKLEVSFSSID